MADQLPARGREAAQEALAKADELAKGIINAMTADDLRSVWRPLSCLLKTIDRGGPPPANPMSRNERDVVVRDPDLLPVVVCVNDRAGFGGKFLCYRLSELEAGRPTVFAVEYHPTADSPVTRAADSLLAGLHAHHTAHLAWVEREERATASHSGGGTVTEESLAVAREFLLEIEDLRRRLDGPR